MFYNSDSDRYEWCGMAECTSSATTTRGICTLRTHVRTYTYLDDKTNYSQIYLRVICFIVQVCVCAYVRAQCAYTTCGGSRRRTFSHTAPLIAVTIRIIKHIPTAKSTEITYLMDLIYCFGYCKNIVMISNLQFAGL